MGRKDRLTSVGINQSKVVFADKAREKAVKAELDCRGQYAGRNCSVNHTMAQDIRPRLKILFPPSARKRKPLIPAALARHTVDVVLGIFQSHRSRKWVKNSARIGRLA